MVYKLDAIKKVYQINDRLLIVIVKVYVLDYFYVYGV